MILKESLWSVKLVLKFSFASAKFQLRYLLSSAQKIWCLRVWVGGRGDSGSGSASAKFKDQPSANQYIKISFIIQCCLRRYIIKIQCIQGILKGMLPEPFWWVALIHASCLFTLESLSIYETSMIFDENICVRFLLLPNPKPTSTYPTVWWWTLQLIALLLLLLLSRRDAR